MRAKHGNDKTISLDKNGMNFACKVPIFEYDSMGRPIVRIWECKTKRMLTYTQQEFERKKSVGEL